MDLYKSGVSTSTVFESMAKQRKKHREGVVFGPVDHSKKAYDKSLQAGKFAVALSEAGKNGQQITDALNDAGFTTPRGGNFSRTQTLRLLQRYGS